MARDTTALDRIGGTPRDDLPVRGRSSSLLRAAGLRATVSRLAVLDILTQRPQPQSHADVLASLGAQGFDRATVYRNLTDLVTAGIARRADFGDHVWRFSLASRGPGKPLFVCTDCGDLQTLPDGAVILAKLPRAPRSFRRRQVAVEVKGRCDGCV